MTDRGNERAELVIRRVVVAHDGAGSSAVLARAAALLARTLGAGLSGVYVREAALGDLARLPFATALGRPDGPPERMSAQQIDRAWRRAEVRFRADLARALGDAGDSPPVLETNSGRFHAVIAARIARATLVAISAEGLPGDAMLRGLMARLRETGGAALVVPAAARTPTTGPVLAIDDGGDAGAAAIALADRIATAIGQPLAVLALATPAGFAPRDAAVHAWPHWQADEIARPIARIAPMLIVGNAAGRPFTDREVSRPIFHRLAAPLLVAAPESREG